MNSGDAIAKTTKRFIEECIYGIQASGDAKLSSIVRAIDDDIRPIYTEKRLSLNLNNDKLADPIAQAILKDGARSVTSDTLLLVDPTEIRKEYSYKMQYVTRVRDASRSSAAYSIAAGLKRAFTRFGKWIRTFAFKKWVNSRDSSHRLDLVDFFGGTALRINDSAGTRWRQAKACSYSLHGITSRRTVLPLISALA